MFKRITAATAVSLATLAVSPLTTTIEPPAAFAADAGTDGLYVVRPEHVDPNEIVETYTPDSGFAAVRLDHVPLVVGFAPEFEPGMTLQDRIDWLDPVLDQWNTVAGWNIMSQQTENTPDDAVQVRFHLDAETVCPDAGACVTWEFSQDGWAAGGWYLGCDVHFWPWYPTQDMVAHELGHCLGFMDVPDPEADGYYGIMSYGRQWGATPVNQQDRNSMIAAGYAE